jgi:hypothetical protein
MPRLPRPARPPRRTRILNVRLSEAEYAALQERAQATSIHTIAGYLRAAGLGQPAPPAARPVPAANLEQYTALGHAAANLNQVAKHLNQGYVVTDRDLMPVLRQLYEDVQQVRRLLLGAAPASETRSSQ